ncbi:MAG: aspartate aminotransferase family protein [Desulfosalsimonadaceae bacterium]
MASDSKQAVFKKFAGHVSSGKARFFQDYGLDFVFGRREGPYVWDMDGDKRLINCHSNGGLYNLGHRHPAIVDALAGALKTLDIGNHHFVSREKAELAEKLAELCPGDLEYVIFGASGGEAIDTAIKIARKATRRSGVISAIGGYHGHTGLALAAGDPKYRDPFFSSVPEFIQVPFNDVIALKNALHPKVAAVIIETIPATLGMPIPDSTYFQEVKRLCGENGSLLIIDEVQTGLGRTGRFWGIEHYETVPDIMVSAKGLGGGIYPVTAAIIRKDLESVFHEDPFIHISTSGGADIGCVVAGKVLEISSTPEFLDHVKALAAVFKKGMADILAKYPGLLTEFRQLGLMSSLKTVHPDTGPLLSKACYDAGLLCVYAGNDTSVLQFLPPLIITTALAAEILERMEQAVHQADAFMKAFAG